MRVPETAYVMFSLFIFGFLLSSCIQDIPNDEIDPTIENFSESETVYVATETIQSKESPTADTELFPTPTKEAEIQEFSFEGLPDYGLVVLEGGEYYSEVYLLGLPCWGDENGCEDALINITEEDAPSTLSGSPSISPDGKFIAFAADRYRNDMDIFVYNLSDQTTAQITNTPNESENYLAWSPDGQSIVFVSETRGSSVKTIGRTGCCASTLPQAETSSYFPEWSPDYMKIAFLSSSRFSFDDMNLYMYSFESKELIKLVQGIPWKMFAWSPDSTKIAFVGQQAGSGNPAICIYYLDKLENSCIEGSQWPKSNPIWSLDGRKIFFTQRNPDTKSYDLYSVDLVTLTIREIMETGQSYDRCYPMSVKHLLCSKQFWSQEQMASQVAIVDIDNQTEKILVERDFVLFIGNLWFR